MKTKKEIKELKAFILEENIISRKVFLDLGFEYIDIKNYENVDLSDLKKCLKINFLRKDTRWIKRKSKNILIKMEEKFGKPQCALNFIIAFELLVAVILRSMYWCKSKYCDKGNV